MKSLKLLLALPLVLPMSCLALEAQQLPDMTVIAQPETSVTTRINKGFQTFLPKINFYKTFPESLATDPEVSLQATGNQQQSPFIHGFTAYRNVLLVDGIRLNSAIMRDGPNQYWSTVDPYTIDSADMYFGQPAMLFGSDTFGAAANIHSRKREDYTKEGFNWNGRAAYRFGSAESSNIGRLEFEGNYGKKFGFLVGSSIKDFGNMSGGSRTGVQLDTGYNEQDVDARFDYHPTDKSTWTVVNQHYQSNGAPRTHSTIYGNTLFGNSLGSYLYRNYDQTRDLAYIKFDTMEIPLFDTFTVTTSFQQFTESQNRQKPRQGRFLQGFTDNIAGLNLRATNDNTRIGNLTYGLDYYHDFISSFGTQFNPDGSFNSNAVQGPVADGSSFDNLGVYLSDDIPIVSDRVVLSLTSRYNYAAAKSGLIEDGSSPTGASPGVNNSWSAFTNGGRLNIGLDEQNHYKVFAGVNQGWRAPTIFDLTGDELARSTDIQVPTPGLAPEKFVTYETGAGYQDMKLKATATYFNTQLSNVIVRYPTGNILDGDTEVKGANKGNGFIQGVAVKSEYALLPQLKAFASFAWTEGHLNEYKQLTNVWVRDPASRINPTNGNVGFHWDIVPKVFAETNARFVAPQARLSDRDIADTQRIPPGGSRGYSLWDIRVGWKSLKAITLSGEVANLLNEDYRVLGSGINGLGRNFIVSVDYRF